MGRTIEFMATPFPLDLMPNWRLPSQLGFGTGKVPDAYALGDIWVRRNFPPIGDEFVTVEENPSPHILIGDELLRGIQQDGSRDIYARVRLEGELAEHASTECEPCSSATPCFTGMLFHIDAQNAHLVYRIGNYRSQSSAWEAAWPD